MPDFTQKFSNLKNWLRDQWRIFKSVAKTIGEGALWFLIKSARIVQEYYVLVFFSAIGFWVLYYNVHHLFSDMFNLVMDDAEALRAVSKDQIAGEKFDGIRNLLLGLAALLGVPFFLLNAWIKERQTRTSEQGHMTDRIAKAVEGLGAEKSVKRLVGEGEAKISEDVTEPNLEVRVGAIYALERISQDSPRDHWQVMEILTAYLRENANKLDEQPPEPEITDAMSDEEKLGIKKGFYGFGGEFFSWLDAQPVPRIDFQAVIAVISRRSYWRRLQEKVEKNELDLRGVHLIKPDFHVGPKAAVLSRANLNRSVMIGANLSRVMLSQSNLERSDFRGGQLQRSNLSRAVLIEADFTAAGLIQADLSDANVKGIRFVCADLREANLRNADLSPADLRRGRPRE